MSRAHERPPETERAQEDRMHIITCLFVGDVNDKQCSVCACTCVSDVPVDVHRGKNGSQQLYSSGVLRIINVYPRKKRNSSPASPLSLSKHAPDQPQQDRADRGWARRGGAHTIVLNDVVERTLRALRQTPRLSQVNAWLAARRVSVTLRSE